MRMIYKYFTKDIFGNYVLLFITDSKDRLFQGDIKLKDSDIARLKGLPQAAIAADVQTWNASRIPYTFHPKLSKL